MEIEEILKYSSARIIVNETDYGSGVLFSHPSIQEYVYIISTYHCFKNYDKSDPKVWVTIESTVENQFLIKKYNQILFDEPNDISVIIFNRQDFDNVYLDNFEMLARNEKPAPRSSLSFRGYPLAYKHLMAQVMRGLYLETLSANTFTIESLTPIATFESPEIDIIPGFSGSGIFIESEYGVKLIGIITKYMGAFNNIKCAGFSSTLNKLLSQYQYPIISMLDTPEIEVVDQYFCIENKPEIPVPEIDRKNIVTIVINRLNSGNNIVFIQGDNGLGKTNLVSQFIRNYRDSSIAYFIDPCHNKSYDYENILKNFSDQIHFLLKKKLLIDELRTDYDSYDFRSYVQNSSLRLKRLASKRCIYILIDGLEDLDNKLLTSLKEKVFEYLPFGVVGIKFVITGDPKKLLKFFPNNHKLKPTEIPLYPLTKTEAIGILKTLDLKDQKYYSYLHELSEGNIEKLLFLRNFLSPLKDKNSIIESFQGEINYKINNFYEYVWSSELQKIDRKYEKILAVVAFDDTKRTVKELGFIFDLEAATVREVVGRLGFLIITNNLVSFLFDSFKDFAKGKLVYYKKRVRDWIIKYLITQGKSEDLPHYYSKNKNWNKVIECLSPAEYEKTVNDTRSITRLLQLSSLGLNASFNEKDAKQGFRFSVCSSILKETAYSDSWSSEIEARIASNESNHFEESLRLVHSTLLKEDKLKLLALIAKEQKKINNEVDKKIIDFIKELHEEIDFNVLGSEGIELAADLLYSCPDLAFGLIEKSMGSLDGENAFSWALANLSLKDNDFSKEEDENKRKEKKIASEARNPILQKLKRAISFLSKELTPKSLIEQVEQVDNVGEKFFLLRNWLKTNVKHDKTSEILKYSLDKMIEFSQIFTPNLKLLKDLATPLPYIANKETAKGLFDRFSEQSSIIKDFGLTRDLIYLEFIMVKTQLNYDDFQGAENRLKKISDHILDIEDLSVQSDCLSIFLRNSYSTDKIIGQSHNADDIVLNTEIKLHENLERLLQESAFHYEITKFIINSLTKFHLDLAIEITRTLNTEERRDNALFDVLDTYLERDIESIDFKVLKNIYNLFERNKFSEEALSVIFLRLSDFKEFKKHDLKNYMFFIDEINNLVSIESQCFCYTYAYHIISTLEEISEKLPQKILEQLRDSFKLIDRKWVKIDIAFILSKRFSNFGYKELAQEYLEFGLNNKNSLLFSSPISTSIYYMSIKLAIKAFEGLLYKGSTVENNLKDLEDLISDVPSLSVRTVLWSDIALNAYKNEKRDLANKIVIEKIKTQISKLPSNGLSTNIHSDIITAILKAAPVLFLEDSSSFIEDYLSKLPSSVHKDKAIQNICHFLITNHSSEESLNEKEGRFSISFENAKRICRAIKEASVDHVIYGTVIKVIRSITLGNSSFSNQQKLDLINRFQSICDSKFPDIKNINHDGYKIALNAGILSLKSKESRYSKNWEELIDMAMEIPNESDKIFVINEIVLSVPHRLSSYKKEWTKKAINIINNLPLNFDRYERFVSLIDTMKDLDTNFCKGEIERFYDLNGKEDDPKIALKKKDLIDTIYSFNPEFAESFVTLVGGDPARNRMGTLLKDQVNYRKFLDTVQDSNHTIDGGFSVANKKEYYLKSIQSLLADLNGNVKDIKLKKADDLWDWLKIGSICPFSESMSIYFFYLENLNRHYKKTPHANVILQGLFDSSILCSKLVKILSAKSSDKLRQTFSFYNLDDEVTDKYILDTSKSYEISEDKRSIVFRMLDGDMEDSSIMALTAITAEELQFVKENHLIS